MTTPQNGPRPTEGPTPLPVPTPFGRPIGVARPVSAPVPAAESTAGARQSGADGSSAGAGPSAPADPYAGTFYAQVGGSETFRRLTERFYAGVAADPEFRAIYPEEDLRPAAMRLQLFLEQYWGGPTTYSDRRGHPRLRMRHVPYTVDSAARDTWLRHMRAAVESLELPPLQEATLWDYFDRAAHSLQNAPG